MVQQLMTLHLFCSIAKIGINDRETRILTQFNDWLRKHTKANALMIGHNITKFDDRFIFQRSVINRIKPCYTPLLSQYL